MYGPFAGSAISLGFQGSGPYGRILLGCKRSASRDAGMKHRRVLGSQAACPCSSRSSTQRLHDADPFLGVKAMLLSSFPEGIPNKELQWLD